LGIKWVKTLKHKVSLRLHLQASLCSSLNQAPASSLNNNLLLSNKLQVASSAQSASQHRQHLGNSLGNLNNTHHHRLELKELWLNKQVLYSPNLYRVFRTSLRVLPLAILRSRRLELSLSRNFLSLRPQSSEEGVSLPRRYQPPHNQPLGQLSTRPVCSSNSPQLNKRQPAHSNQLRQHSKHRCRQAQAFRCRVSYLGLVLLLLPKRQLQP
jgi:hypothetical protein